MSSEQIHEEDFKISVFQQDTNNQVQTRLRVSNSSLNGLVTTEMLVITTGKIMQEKTDDFSVCHFRLCCLVTNKTMCLAEGWDWRQGLLCVE